MKLLLLIAWLSRAAVAVGGTIRLSDLDLSAVQQGLGTPRKDRSVTETPLSVAGRTFEHGMGTHANSIIRMALDGKAVRFHSFCGVDDNARDQKASVLFRVIPCRFVGVYRIAPEP